MSTPLTLQHLIHPIDTHSFIEDYLEKQPLVRLRNDPGYFAGLFDLSDIEEFLFTVRPQRLPGAMTMVKHGEPPPPLSPGMSTQAVFNAFREGASLVLNRAHECWPKLAQLVAEIEDALDCPAQTNIYCSPPGVQGFAIHADRHDVIVVQTYGSKQWNLYETKEELLLEDVGLPALTADKSGLATQAASRGGAGDRYWGDPIQELVLNEGDVVYLPRGVPHAAIARDEGSVHLSIGLFPVRWHVFMRNLVDAIAAHDVELRRRVPYEFTSGQKPIQGAQELCDWLAARVRGLGEEISTSRLLGWVQSSSSASGGANPVPSGYLESILDTEEIELDTQLKFRQRQFQWMATWNRVFFSDGAASLSGPLTIKPAVEFFQEHRSFRVGDLPEALGDSSKLVLCQRMIREGFLQRVRST